MSDSPQGPGWWQASDGKWYPPESTPGGTPAPAGGGPVGADPQIGEALSYGWAKFQANLAGNLIGAAIGFAIVAVLAVIGYVGVLGTLISSSGECTVNETTGRVTCDAGTGMVVQLIAYAIFIFLWWLGYMLFDMLMIKLGLLTTAGESPEPSKLLNSEGLGAYMIGALIMGALVAVGTLLCYVPGLILGIFFMVFGRFYGYYIFDKQLAPVDAIKASINFVKDNLGRVLLFLIVVSAINWVGYVLCCVGLLVTMPLTAIATAYFYKKFDGQPVAA